jgi:outer membrane receptor for ferrienterochelin and colicin
VGYQTQQETGIRLDLGERRTVNFELPTATQELDEVQVIAEQGVFSRERTGISSNVSEEDIDNAPAVGRELADFVRLSPLAVVGNDDDDGSSISIAGQNNRYNSVFIDGAISNDVFGLAAQGTDGGQTGATPISIDALEQFQIDVSPYDVTQSFFGGGAINAVTRSGTNQFEGSVAFLRRDENFAQDLPEQPFPAFTNNRYVGRLGGPIVQDKLFFFANFDILRSETPQPFVGFNDFRENSATITDPSSLQNNLLDFVNQAFDYAPGDFGDKVGTLESDKFLGKLDWNITQNHRVSARYSYSGSDNVDAFRSDDDDLNFSSRNEVFPNTTQIAALEWNGTFGTRFANKMILSYKNVEDDRDTNLNTPFPTIDIDDGAADIGLGGEPFSTVNFLSQEIFTLTNNFNAFFGDHTITIGTHNEFYDISNKFIPFNYGWYFFSDQDDDGTGIDEFKQAACAALDPSERDGIADCAQFGPNPTPPNSFVLRGFSLVDDEIGDATNAAGAFRAAIYGFYIQDEWQVSDRVRLTGGIRVDIPQLLDDPRYATADDPQVAEFFGGAANVPAEINPYNTTIPAIRQFHSLNGALPGEVPSPSPHWAPRFGFNWDAFGDQTTQVRGGVGVFTSRQPFVWPGGMYLNNGVRAGEVANFGANEFRPDPNNGLTVADVDEDRTNADLIPSGRLEMFEEDYKLPRFLRYSLGMDQQLPGGFVGTLEGQYTNTLQNINVTNVNLKPANSTLDGPDNRPIWVPENYNNESQLIDDRYTNIHRVGNTNRGYSYNITSRIQNQFENLFTANSRVRVDVSYTYGDSWVINDGTSSQINSLWDGVEHVNGANSLQLSRSDFSTGHRILGRLTYSQEFLNNFAASVSLVYDGQSGQPFSYIIDDSDELVQENGDPNSLLYVPRTASALTFEPAVVNNITITPEQQAAALDQFIAENDYLRTRRGDYAERNADRTPFESVLDLNFKLGIFGDVVGRQQRIEITADIFNFSSMLGDLFGTDWGTRYFGFGQFSPISFQEFVDEESGDYTPVYRAGAIVDTATDANGTTFFNGAISQEDVYDILRTGSTYSSQWQMQVGVRYTF